MYMPNSSANNKRIAKNTIFLYSRMIIVLLVSLYTTRVVLNVLGVEDYGIYNVVAGFVSMFTFLSNSMNNTIQRYYNYERGAGSVSSLNEVFITAIQIQLVLAIVTCILLESVGTWYINNKMVIPESRLSEAKCVFQFSVFALMLVFMQIPYSAAIISHEKMNFFAVVSIADAVLRLTIAITLPIVTCDKLLVYGLLSMFISLIDFFLYFLYAKRRFEEIKFGLRYYKRRFIEMLSFSWWNMFGSLAYTLQGQGLNVLMNAFFGPVVNAARGIAYQIDGALNGFSANIATAFRPQLVGSYAMGDYRRTQIMMFSMSKYCFSMLFVLSVPIVLELHNILNLWLKGVIPDYTPIFTYLVLANMLLGCLNMPISQTVQATGNVKHYQIIRSLLVASTLPIAWMALRLGASPPAVFWITIVISIINQPLSMAILHREFSYSYREYYKKVIVPCSLLTIITPIVPIAIHYLMPESIQRLIIVTMVSLFISVVFVYVLVLNKSEKEMIKLIVCGFFQKKGKNVF